MRDARPPSLDRLEVEGLEIRTPPGLDDEERGHLRAILAGEDYPMPPGFPSGPALVVDVGANAGAFTAFVRHRFPECRVIAYEPSPTSLPALRENAATLGGVEVVEGGLFAQAGDREIRLGRHRGGFCDSIHPNALTTDRTIAIRGLAAASELSRLGAIALLKLDTEGCEREILAHAPLDRIEAIVLEFHAEADRRAIDAWLSPGFTLYAARVTEPHRGVLGWVRTSTADALGLDRFAIDS